MTVSLKQVQSRGACLLYLRNTENLHNEICRWGGRIECGPAKIVGKQWKCLLDLGILGVFCCCCSSDHFNNRCQGSDFHVKMLAWRYFQGVRVTLERVGATWGAGWFVDARGAESGEMFLVLSARRCAGLGHAATQEENRLSTSSPHTEARRCVLCSF